MLRVIAGELKGRRLAVPKDDFCRPTLDRVKESIFNVLGTDVVDRQVLDLFCGTGSLGIEALSRGASDAVFMDANNKAIALAQKNISMLGLDKRANFILSDIHRFDWTRFKKGFELIIADPPYEMMIGSSLIETLLKNGILADGGLMVFERSRQETIKPEPLKHIKSLKFGQTEVDFFLKSEKAE
jgi:16S rRNA (guanine966-N2)-methyltransferase